MLVLFVSVSDTYRSRLAEAYLKYLGLNQVYVRSAGIHAQLDLDGAITPWAERLLDGYGLEEFGKPTWTQLGQGLLDQADMVVCMNHSVFTQGRELGLEFPLRTVIWDVPDACTMLRNSPSTEERMPHLAHKTFLQIVERVNELAIYLRRPKPTEQVDILTPDGEPTGRRTDVDSIHTRGLWHQGVHALVYTNEGAALFEKRSESIIGNPGLWDMTLGGISAAGEKPDTTVRRELEEELGVLVTPAQVSKLFVWRYNHYLPSYGLHNRSLIHTYLIEIPHPSPLMLQQSEVADAQYLRFRQAAAFIGAGHSVLGHMPSSLHYYRRVLSEAERAHSTRKVPVVAA